ncbi:MAG: ammonium transporter, partial [Nitrososphaerota archaeon]
GFIGAPSLAGFAANYSIAGFHSLDVPPTAYLSFQLMFAIITAALISGACAERIKFSSFVVFICIWLFLVYIPIAHWSFSPEGWLARRGLLDFAGGTVVEICSGFSSLGLVLALGKRHNWPKEAVRPHSVPLALAGAGIIWFGWFGFNAGSALQANQTAAIAFLNTQVAAGLGLCGWLIVERIKDSHPTTLGAVSGAIAGMVAITPCAGFVEPPAAIVIGLLAGIVCSIFVSFKQKFRLDDTLDVLGVHGIGGVIGTILVGLFATKVVNSSGKNGLFFGGGFHALAIQILGVGASAAWAFALSYLIAMGIKKLIGLRPELQVEMQGLDINLHQEAAYSLSDVR